MITLTERTEFAVEVYDYVISATESLEVDRIGSTLTYLMAAILKNGWCDLEEDEPLVVLLKKWTKWEYLSEFVELSIKSKPEDAK